MLSMRSASASTSRRIPAVEPRLCVDAGPSLGKPRVRLQPVELVIGIGKLVGDHEAGHEQEADLADPAHGLRKLLCTPVDISRELGHMLFLAIVAGDRVPPPPDGDRNLAHCPF